MADYPKRAPTATGIWPARPSRRVDAQLAARFPRVFNVGDPIGYTRDPSKWLPEYSLESMPIVLAGDVNPFKTWYDTNNTDNGRTPTRDIKKQGEDMDNDSIQDNTSVEDTVDPRTPEQQAPKRGDKSGSEPSAPKAAKAAKAAKTAWEPTERMQEAVNIMREVAQTGDKKALAYFVAQAIECRAEGKIVRESLADQD